MEDNRVAIKFLGAAGTVTGSKHLLQTPEMKIMIDCGLFQGLKELRLKNWEPLPIQVSELAYIIITHAHLDHVGYLPAIIKQGFRGRILMTTPTKALAALILKDSAKIQEEDAAYANEQGFSKHEPALPLYTLKDAEKAITFFETREDNEWVTLSSNIRFRFEKNGHILGSAYVEFDCFGKQIIFSGDLGKVHSYLLKEPVVPEIADYLVMESTYGDRLHDKGPVEEQLAGIINNTIWNKGTVLIPSFAVGRAQEIMYLINRLRQSGSIPRNLPVYFDSPMGSEATKVLLEYPLWHKLSDAECRAMANDIRYINNFSETASIAKDKHPKIVIAASGMLTGGRILHYLKTHLGRENSTVLLVGFQAEGTRGRALHDGIHELKIHGHYFPVKCAVAEISSLSAHADQQGLLNWVDGFQKKPRKIFLVHGEAGAQNALRVKIQDQFSIAVDIPKQNDERVLE